MFTLLATLATSKSMGFPIEISMLKESFLQCHVSLGGGFQHFFVHSYLGKIPNLTNIFQRGWFNHQPVVLCPGKFSCGAMISERVLGAIFFSIQVATGEATRP